LLTVTTMLPGARYSTDAQRMTFADSVIDRVRVLPGVAGAAYASDLPFSSIGDTTSFRVEGRPNTASAVDLDALYREATNGYLQTIGARLLAGRFYNEFDRASSQPVLVVNETFARAYWPAPQSALGHRVLLGGEKEPWRTIVGVVADIRERGLLLSMKPAVYLADDQVHLPDTTYLAVRTAGDPMAVLSAVRQAIWSVDREQPVSNPSSMRELMSQETGSRRQAMILLSAFAGLALLLAALGIYGVLSYAVTQRTREIGIRLALGAERRKVVGMMLRIGMSVASIGVALGVAAAFVLTRALAKLLYGVRATDPLTFAAVAAFLLAISAVACYVPARRAAGVDALIALRYE
jgi:putative ABC transport system permease protein